jgi:hypothetical protein
MPRIKLRCRRCKAEVHRNYLTDMTCHLKDNQNRECGGLLVRIDSHLEKRIDRAKSRFAEESKETT